MASTLLSPDGAVSTRLRYPVHASTRRLNVLLDPDLRLLGASNPLS